MFFLQAAPPSTTALLLLLNPRNLPAFSQFSVRLFKAQSEYADRVAVAVEGENHCTGQMRLLIDEISMQRERVVVLEEKLRRQEEECEQLRTHVQNLERKGVKNLFQQLHAAVVIMACNRADYLERTIDSILKYHGSVTSKFPVFVSQNKGYELQSVDLTYMQHLDYEPVVTERPGELIAYYKIARLINPSLIINFIFDEGTFVHLASKQAMDWNHEFHSLEIPSESLIPTDFKMVVLQKGSWPPQDRTMVVACLAEVAQDMGAPITAYVDTIMPLVHSVSGSSSTFPHTSFIPY
ncbi:hypothetical protein LXL04_035306 [Taraxacum kok-saghyz]